MLNTKDASGFLAPLAPHARTLLAEGVDVAGAKAKALLGDPDSDLAELLPS